MFRFDDDHPQFLIVYTGDDHATPQDYVELGERWIARLQKGQRFGVIVVSEPHEHHDHDHDDDEHRQHEAEIMRLINDFRRQYRDQTAQLTVGYARVVPPEWMELYFSEAGSWELMLETNDRFAQYNWGIRGGGFTDLKEAQDWILAQFTYQPEESNTMSTDESGASSQRIGLFYGSSTGTTEYVAEEIADAWAKAGLGTLNAVNIGEANDLSQLLAFDTLILGVPTWNIGQLQDDWDILFPQLDDLDFTGKKVAIFGVGDQYGYPDNFLDGIGILGNKLIERGAVLVGHWVDDNYEFSESVAFADGKFMGLGLDETHQSSMTDDRIQGWIAQLVQELSLQPS